MSFQGYLDTIKAKTGKGPEDFKALAAERGLLGPGTKAGEVVAWLKQDFDLGRGHAMAIYAILSSAGQPRASAGERIDAVFAGGKARWRPLFDDLLQRAGVWGGVGLSPTSGYVSLLRDGAKFAIVQPTAARLDIGIKRPGVPAQGRFEAAGAWNAMVTHRVRIATEDQLDDEVLAWLRQAWEAAGKG